MSHTLVYAIVDYQMKRNINQYELLRALVKLPVVKLILPKSLFTTLELKFINDLPLAIRKLDDYSEYIKAFFT